MALVRCKKCGKPKGRTRKYIRNVEPVGFPNTSSICGRKDCSNPGLVWLEAFEWRKYQEDNERIFEIPSRTVKIRTK